MEAETQGSGFAKETPRPTSQPEATGPEPLEAAGLQGERSGEPQYRPSFTCSHLTRHLGLSILSASRLPLSWNPQGSSQPRTWDSGHRGQGASSDPWLNSGQPQPLWASASPRVKQGSRTGQSLRAPPALVSASSFPHLFS